MEGEIDKLNEILRNHTDRFQRQYAAKALAEMGQTKDVVQYMSDKEKSFRGSYGFIFPSEWVNERNEILRIIDETDPKFLYKTLSNEWNYRDYLNAIQSAMYTMPTSAFGFPGYTKMVKSALNNNPQEALEMISAFPGLFCDEEIYSTLTEIIESTLTTNPREGLRLYVRRPRIIFQKLKSTEDSIDSTLRRLTYSGEDVDLRIESIRAIGVSDGTEQYLIHLLKSDHEPRVRYCVADLFGGRSTQRIFLSPDINSALKTALRDKDPELRKHASESLARGIGFPGRSVLIEALDDPDPDVKKLALETLRKYHEQEAAVYERNGEELMQLLTLYIDRCKETIFDFDRSVNEHENTEIYIAERCVERLAELGERRAIPLLETLAQGIEVKSYPSESSGSNYNKFYYRGEPIEDEDWQRVNLTFGAEKALVKLKK